MLRPILSFLFLLSTSAFVCGGGAAHASPLSVIPQQSGQIPQQTIPSGRAPQNPSGTPKAPHAAIPLPNAPSPTKPTASPAIMPDGIYRPLLVPRLATEPRLENFVSGSPDSLVAQSMLDLTGFVQQDPDDGAPVTEATSAFLGYTGHDLYIAFICRDRNPQDIRAHLLPRDHMSDDDRVEITFDTFNDHRRGLLFQTNAFGVQADAAYTEGQPQPDFSFDTVWDTWGRRTSFGYVALMRIPFQSLRFRSAGPDQLQLWGMVLGRSIPHASERAYWPRITRQIAGRLTQDAPIVGFAGVQRGHNLQLIPYVIGQNYRKLDDRNPLAPTFDQKLLQGTAGIDAKAVLHNSLVLDATLNPDFSQVNVDNPAPPNQRFQTYFQEQRPFFIENANYFTTPINLFYTLNIVSPQVGARLSGKLGPWAVGLLATDDRSPGQAVAPGTPYAASRAQFYVGRVARDIGPFSSAGVLYTDREYHGSFNRLGGIDYRYRFHKQWTLTGQTVYSATRSLIGGTSSGQSTKQNLNFSGENLNFGAAYNDTARGFQDSVGFFRRPDIRETHIQTNYTWRPAGRTLLSHGPSFYVEQDWDHTGLALDSLSHLAYSFQFRRRTQITPYLNVNNDRLRPSDYSQLTRNVEYRSQVAGVEFFTSPIPQFALEFNTYAGKTINNNPPAGQGPRPIDVHSIETSLEIKPTTRLDLQNTYEFDHFRAPGAAFIAYDNHQAIARWNLQMTRALALRAIVIYASTIPNQQFTGQQNSKDFFTDLLLSFVPHPGTAIYLGYANDSQNLNPGLCARLETGQCDPNGVFLNHTGDSLLNDKRALYLKFSYLLRF